MSRKNNFDLICIRCPKGCELTIRKHNDEIKVYGNECKLGEEYAVEETKNPRRIIPTTVRIKNARYPRLPVRTNRTVPKNKIREIIEDLKETTVQAPVEKNDVIIENISNTGVDIIAERSMRRVKK
ncbi:MAG: DUF1667 domain-containing protein [Candidatus Thermoplasmatota archaeon]